MPRACVCFEVVQRPLDDELFSDDVSGECDDLDAVPNVGIDEVVDLGDEEDLFVYQTGGGIIEHCDDGSDGETVLQRCVWSLKGDGCCY